MLRYYQLVISDWRSRIFKRNFKRNLSHFLFYLLKCRQGTINIKRYQIYDYVDLVIKKESSQWF